MGNTISTAPSRLRSANLVKGRGWTQLVYVPQPAAGASATYVVPGDYWERILSVAFTLTTSGTVARRNLNMSFMDGDGNVWNQSTIAQGIPASTTLSGYGDTHGGDTQIPGTDLTAEGTQTSPAALTTIASLTSVPKGEYTATVYLTIAGTPAQGTDSNNVQLDNGAGTVFAVLDNSIAAGVQEFGPFDIEAVALSTIAVRNIGAATAGAIYSATLVVAPKTVVYTWEFPDFLLKSAWQMQITLGNAVAADQLSGIILYTERYPSGDTDVNHADPAEHLASMLMELLGR